MIFEVAYLRLPKKLPLSAVFDPTFGFKTAVFPPETADFYPTSAVFYPTFATMRAKMGIGGDKTAVFDPTFESLPAFLKGFSVGDSRHRSFV